MIKVKDGYVKLIGTTFRGAANHVLLSNGADLEYSKTSKANTLVQRDNGQGIVSAYVTASTEVSTPLLQRSGLLIINSNGLYLKYNNTDAKSIYFNDTYFKPFDAANGNINLGTSGARWKGIYGVTGSFTGNVTAANFVGHLQGNADTATKLTTSAGTAITPIYFKDGKPVAGQYTFGSGNGNAATYTVFPTYTKLVELGYNTEANATKVEEYLKGLCKWLIATYPDGGNFIGNVNPNSRGFCHIYLYPSSNGVKDGLPRYCSGAYYPLSGNVITFNINDYVWGIIPSYVDTTSNQRISGQKTFTLPLIVECGSDAKLVFNNTDGEKYSAISFRENNVEYLYVTGSDSGLRINNRLSCDSYIQGTQLKSTVATGTAPLIISSTTKVNNLNADLLDGFNETSFVRSWWTNSPGYDCSTQNSRPLISFTYNNNAPFTGAIMDVVSNGYGFYLGTGYGADNPLYYRRHGITGDGGMGAWQQLARITDNVASATKLQTARTINGTSFNGTANITTSYWGTARNISIADNSATNTGPASSVNGSGNVTLKLPDTIKGYLTGTADQAVSAQFVKSWDTRDVADTPISHNVGARFLFKNKTASGLDGGGSYNGILHFRPYGSDTDTSGGPTYQLAFTPNGNLYFRRSTGSGASSAWDSWHRILDDSNTFVTSLGTSGNNLTWSTNRGVTHNITIPYSVNADKLDGIHASGLFTNLSNSGNNISVTIGGTNKTLTVGYAVNAVRLGSANSITNVNQPSFYSEDGSRVVYDTFSGTASNKPVDANNANSVLTLYKTKHGTSGQYLSQLAFPDNGHIYYRISSAGTFISWKRVAVATDHLSNPYSLTLQINGSNQVTYDGSSAKTFNVNLSNYVTTNTAQTISGVKTFSSQIKSTVATGTAPFVVNSSTVVANLNAGLLEGYSASKFMRNGDTAASNLNTVTRSGTFRIGSGHSNIPSTAYNYGQMLVLHSNGDTIAQMLFPYNSRRIAVRTGNPSDVGGTGSWGNWEYLALESQIPSIPSKLPNPYSLSLQVNGTTQTTYDGSSSRSFNVSLPSELPNPYGLTLQINGTTQATYYGSSSKTFNVNLPSSVDPTDYYWANVHVSSSSNSGTEPVFYDVTTTSSSDLAFYGSGGFYSGGYSDFAFTVYNLDTTSSTKIAGRINTSATGNTNVISRYLVEYDTSSASIDALKHSTSRVITAWSFKFDKTEVAQLAANGTFYANGFVHRSIASDNYVLLAGGGYKALSSIGATINSAGSGTRPIYTSGGSAYASTSNVGGTHQPMFMYNGTLTAMTSDLGATTRPIYMEKGVLKMCSFTIGASIASGGSAGDLVGFISDGLIGAYPGAPVGNPYQGIYLNGCRPEAMICSLRANVEIITPNTVSGAMACYNTEYNRVFPLEDSIGTRSNPVYINKGVPIPTAYSLQASVNEGTAGALAYYYLGTSITNYTGSVGHQTNPIYIDKGVPKSCSGYVIKHFARYELDPKNRSSSWISHGQSFSFLMALNKNGTGNYSVTVSYPAGFDVDSTWVWCELRFPYSTYGYTTSDGYMRIAPVTESSSASFRTYGITCMNSAGDFVDAWFYLYFLCI